MFKALHASALPSNTYFPVTIGPPGKLTDADWYLTEPTEVFATILMLNEATREGIPVTNDGKPRDSKLLPVPRSWLMNYGRDSKPY